MTTPSRARLFFDEATDFAFMQSLIGNADAAENGWRDYKEAGFVGRDPNDDNKIKEIWSETLSAFANTGGGVLIWGIKAKGKIPEKLSLANDCEQLADRLRTLTNNATDPYVVGVEVKAIGAGAGKEGLVVCYVPQSTFAPHQALWGTPAYFVRSQDSSVVCPQPLLRTMFYPRLIAHLGCTSKFLHPGPMASQARHEMGAPNYAPASRSVVPSDGRGRAYRTPRMIERLG